MLRLKYRKKLKLNVQKNSSKWRRAFKTKTDVTIKDKEIDKLTEEVHMLENENFELKEEIEEFLQDQEVKTFEGGKYSDSVCKVYQYCVAQGISYCKVED